ncbi:MAG: SDR family NAD(P)-dependent oxidoreductase [Candidatus Dormiibacterota bacterium]
MNLEGSTVLLTGASKGIGAATAVVLAHEGANVALVARHLEALEEVARRVRDAGTQAHPIVADMSKEEDVRRMVAEADEKLGGIDIIVNNAGLGLSAPVKDIKPEDLRYVFEVNVVAPTLANSLVLPGMLRRKRGHVVNVGSVASHIASPDLGGYAATKHALKALSDALRMELQGTGVRVTLVCPGPIATDFTENTRGKYPDHYPKRPVGAPAEDVGRAIARAIQKRLAEVFIPAYFQPLVGIDAMVPQIMRVGGKRGMKVATRIADRFM